MKVYIIERNQVINNRFFYFWFFAFSSFLIFIIPKIAFANGEPIIFEKGFSYAALFFGITGIIILAINIFSFKKTGNLKIEEGKIKIENKGLTNSIKLDSVKSLKVKRIQGNIYKVKVNNLNLELAMDKQSLTELKSINNY